MAFLRPHPNIAVALEVNVQFQIGMHLESTEGGIGRGGRVMLTFIFYFY